MWFCTRQHNNRVRQQCRALFVCVQRRRTFQRGKMLNNTSSDYTGTNNRVRHCFGVTSRQPPCCGGTPPLPRKRRMPAMMLATDAARMTRRMNFMVGLTRIELVTSSLSGMRSNQLSYSPRADQPNGLLVGFTNLGNGLSRGHLLEGLSGRWSCAHGLGG